jgi:hypothetical protein
MLSTVMSFTCLLDQNILVSRNQAFLPQDKISSLLGPVPKLTDSGQGPESQFGPQDGSYQYATLANTNKFSRYCVNPSRFLNCPFAAPFPRSGFVFPTSLRRQPTLPRIILGEGCFVLTLLGVLNAIP